MVVLRGAGGQVGIGDRGGRKLGVVVGPDASDVNADSLAKDEAVQRFVGHGGPLHVLMDYGDRVDDQPVYIGEAPAAAPFTHPVWKVIKFRYESDEVNARVVESDTRLGLTWMERSMPESQMQPSWGF